MQEPTLRETQLVLAEQDPDRLSQSRQQSLTALWGVLLQCSSAGMVRCTKKARRVVFCACEQAIREKSNVVTPEHLLVGLLHADHSLEARFGLPTIDTLRNGLTKISQRQQVATHLALSEAAKRMILLAAEERKQLSHKHTGPNTCCSE